MQIYLFADIFVPEINCVDTLNSISGRLAGTGSRVRICRAHQAIFVGAHQGVC